jgi:urea carboxylase
LSTQTILIANRGEIACRIISSVKKLGLRSVAVYSDADRDAPHVRMADVAVHLGNSPVSKSYLDVSKLLAAAKEHSVDAVHPGYGLLSENAEFAESCEAADIRFIGPTPQQMRSFGLKHEARRIAEESGVPLAPGTGLLDSKEDAADAADEIGYPVMVKSTAGGGGIGMRVCADRDEVLDAFDAVTRMGETSFGHGALFVEKFVARARHVEVQIFGDGKGRVAALGERDCSTQRRNQKVIEESPAPNLPADVRQALLESATRLAEAVNYRSAGTVEFLYDEPSQEFYFLEVNTRLQVEHGVTEAVTGLDLVENMIRLAAGETDLPAFGPITYSGHSIQVRLYSEDPARDFQPCSGLLTEVDFPEGPRVDTWIETGTEVSPFYDPLIAKIIVHADDRASALSDLREALAATSIAGIETNLDYLRQIIADGEPFSRGEVSTKALESFIYRSPTIEVIAPGTQTTVQDFPGRVGYWNVGVPPSGPMDMLSLRVANSLVGNDPSAAGLEITVNGPTLRFHQAARVAICGAPMPSKLDGGPIAHGAAIDIEAGSVLSIEGGAEVGVRSYLAVSGGLQVPDYLGSKSTFTLGRFGGHGGRALLPGDMLHLTEDSLPDRPAPVANFELPEFTNHWDIGVIYGPHGAPDYFTGEDIEMVFGTDWEVHYNSARTGVRLIGPKPKWARPDGGEAGLHPSNIHDNAYAIGALDFTGDMPVILGPDGPSLGGFVCPCCIVAAELWKVGQLKPSDTVRFRAMSDEQARHLEAAQEIALEQRKGQVSPPVAATSAASESAVAKLLPASAGTPHVTFRPSGDRHLLVEYGDNILDLELRFRVHAVHQHLLRDLPSGVTDITPGMRSFQVQYDSRQLASSEVIDWVEQTQSVVAKLDDLEVPSRTVHLPLSWDDPSTQEAIDKYVQSVNPDAPWCPSNIEFIRRINGLDSIEQVREILFGASYLVMGLGDVYLGAPVATPLDPRHRLVTTKYNPARTWTPENAVGIGGAYLCIYGMEGPGGYQFVGRTVQMWNRFHSTSSFAKGTPWLLRVFDQIKWHEVSADELTEMRQEFPLGRWNPKIENSTLRLSDQRKMMAENADGIAAFKSHQQASFEAERERWAAAGIDITSAEETPEAPAETELPEGCVPVQAAIAGNLWQVRAEPGQAVEAGQTIAIIEAMKMEMAVIAPSAGIVREIYTAAGQPVSPGQCLIALEPT